MTLGKMLPNTFKAIKAKDKLRRKVVQIELAWREHEKAQGIHPHCSFSEAIERGMKLWGS